MTGVVDDRALQAEANAEERDIVLPVVAEAQLVHMEKRTSELEALYLKAVEADPTSFDALAALAGFYGSQGQEKNMELANRYVRLLDPGRN